MTGIRRTQDNPAAIRQSVIEAVRRLERGHDAEATGQDTGAFRLLTEALPVAVFVWSGVKIVYTNGAARKLAGVADSDELIGKRATDLMEPDDREALSRILLRGSEADDVRETQTFQMLRPDGSSFAVDAQLAALDWEGRPALVAIVNPAAKAAPSADDADAPPAGTNGDRDIEPPDLPPEVEQDDWWSATEAPLAAYREAVDHGAPGLRGGGLGLSLAQGDALDFSDVEIEIADQILTLPPIDGERAIVVDAQAGTLDWDVDSGTDGLTPIGFDAQTDGRAPELDEAQRLSEAALAATTNGIVITDALDAGYPIIYVNAAFERITGYAFDEVVGRNANFLYGDDTDQEGIAEIRSAIAERRAGTALVRNYRKDGSVFWNELRIAPAEDDQGRVTHVVGVQTDVTERVSEEKRRREAEGRLGAFTETAAEWFWEFDADLRYAFASEKYYALTGDSPDDILGKTIYEFQKGVATAELDTLFATLEAAKPFAGHVFSRARSDGSAVWFSSDGQPVTDENGAFVGYRGSARDITAELAAQRALSAAEERHRRLTAGLPAMTYQRVQSADGTLIVPFVSDAVREIYGLETADVIADPDLLARHVVPEDRAAMERLFKDPAGSVATVSAEYRIRDAEGREKWILTRARPRRTEGRGIVWDCVAIDATESKREAHEVAESRRMYRTMVESAPHMAFCFDQEGRIEAANARFAEHSGRAIEALEGAEVAEVLPEDAAKRIMDVAAQVFASGQERQQDVELDDDADAPSTFDVCWTPIAAEGGGIARVRVTWTDVTQARLAEAGRRESEKRLQLVMNELPVQIAYIDKERRYRFANRLHHEAIGLSKETLAGEELRTVLGEQTFGEISEHVDAALSGKAARFEWVWNGSDEPRHLETTFTPHVADDGAVRGFFASFADVTDREKATAEVADRDRRLSDLALNLPGFVYQRVVDWQGNVSFPYVSDGISKLLGIESSELVGNPALAFDVVHPDDLPKVKEATEASRIEITPYDIEVRLATRSGRTVWVRNLARPHLRKADNAVVWDGLMLDITDRKAAEDSREASEDRYRALVELSPDAVLIHDGERIIFANEAAAKLNAEDAADSLVGRAMKDLIGAGCHAGISKGFAQVIDNGRPMTFTPGQWARADGTEREVEIAAAPTTWLTKPAALCVIRDVTDLRATESALQETEDRLRTLVNLSPDAIYVNAGGRIAYANAAAPWLFGVASNDDLIGASALDFAAPENVSDIKRRAAMVDAGEIAPWVERTRTLATGETVHYETMSVPIEWKGVPSRLVINRDISQRKQAEQTLETAEARATAAEQAARVAETANERFLASMGHEIRTPLNGILGMAGLLIDSGLGEDQRHHAETIRQSGKTLLSILNDIIELSKLKDGPAKLEVTDFEVRPAVESVLEVLAPSAFAKGIDLAAYVAPNAPEWLAGDPGRLRQVLLNLVGNAIKFTERGAVTVKVNVAGTAPDRVTLMVRVADTGAGIPEDAQSGLFDGDGEPTVVPAGAAGVGLAVCREIVQSMNGEIGVESTPGRGSTFWFKAELAPAERPADNKIVPLIASLSGRQAMLVGGNSISRQLVRKQLSAFGVSVATAKTGVEALSLLADAAERRAAFDLVMVDLALSDMEATEFAQRIHDEPCHRDLKLILTAPTGRSISLDRARDLGYDAALKKPIRQQALVTRMAALFGADVRDRGASHEPRADKDVRSLRILVAEDNPANQQIVASMLIQAGHRVDIANNGIEAVNAVRNLPYDAVLMDIRMPEMDGVTAAKLVRAFTGDNAHVPIIGMASNDAEGAEEDFLEAGMNIVVSKPIDLAKLEEAIERLCARDEQEDETTDLPLQPRQVPPITAEERSELKNLLASLDDIVENGR